MPNKAKTQPPVAEVKVDVTGMELPKEPTKPRADIGRSKLWLHGEAGAGKTTLASHFENSIFLDTDRGTDALEVYRIPIASWRDTAKAVKLLVSKEHDFKTVVFDVVELHYHFLSEQVSRDNGVKHLSELGFGSGYDQTNKRFRKVLDDLHDAGLGVVLVSHTRDKELTLGGIAITKKVPDVSDSPRKVFIGWSNEIIYLAAREGEQDDDKDTGGILPRYAICQPTTYVEAKSRAGLPQEIDLGSDPKAAFGQLKQAFDKAMSVSRKSDTKRDAK